MRSANIRSWMSDAATAIETTTASAERPIKRASFARSVRRVRMVMGAAILWRAEGFRGRSIIAAEDKGPVNSELDRCRIPATCTGVGGRGSALLDVGRRLAAGHARRHLDDQ